eukprot:CAMPEP_0204904308 /NCGR_PEP_ID=MMETSP1397-20131031/4790_1 /ASSEMBLY_ACC=CAM_ASM_000891 /TAXON_ID=49980 /ORGANISM="Climacostomum Climacostomum virens, Strain Stock W-24" /LENGTH=537 /DNA_ID=CAMNT_0052073089 /DNA_START=2290 /DNA_END=3903 /DNA_ORIENTATION=+
MDSAGAMREKEVRFVPIVIDDVNIDIPPGDQLTMHGLREILLQITSTLKQHSQTHRNLVENSKGENRLRPTFIELSKMFTTSLTSVNAAEYVHVEAVERIAQKFSSQVHSSLTLAQQEVSNMRTEVSRINDKFLDGFRRLDQRMTACIDKAKQSVDHNKTLAGKMFHSWRMKKLFGAWKDHSEVSKLRKKKLKLFFTKFLRRKQREKLDTWRSTVDKIHMKNIEIDLQKALNIGKACGDKLNEIQHNLDFIATSKAEVNDLEAVKRLASSKDHLKVIAEFKEFVEFEIERVYKRVDGDRMKLKEQLTKCEQTLELKAQDSQVSELILACQKFDKDLQGTAQKVYLQDERIARLSYTKKLEDLEFQVDMLHKLVAEAANGVQRMQEEQIYKESYAEALSTKSALPSCLSCGAKPTTSASSPKVVAASGLLGTDKKFYKGDDQYNNLMMPGMKRLTLTEPLSFTEDSSISPDRKSRASHYRKQTPLSGVIPVMTARMRTTSESPTRFLARPVRTSTSIEFSRDIARTKVSSRKWSRANE